MEINLEFLSSVLGTDVEQLTKALKDGDNFKPEADIQSYLKTQFSEQLNQERRSARDEGYGRGKKESLSAKEQEVRKKYDLEATKFDEMLAEMADRAKQTPDLTPEDVRNTEIYKVDMQKRDVKIAELNEQTETTIKSYKAKEVDRKVRSRVKAIMQEKGYVGKEGIREGDFVFNALIGSLNGKDAVIGLNDDGNIVVRDDTGQIKLDDQTVKPVVFDDFVTSRLDQVYVIPSSDDRKSPGNQNGKGKGKGENPKGYTMPKDDAEYMDTLNALPVAEKSGYIEFHDAQLAK